MKNDEIARACSMHARGKYAYKDMLRKLKGKPLRRHVRRWKENIEMDLKEIEWQGFD
jgi:hypothetical protein